MKKPSVISFIRRYVVWQNSFVRKYWAQVKSKMVIFHFVKENGTILRDGRNTQMNFCPSFTAAEKSSEARCLNLKNGNLICTMFIVFLLSQQLKLCFLTRDGYGTCGPFAGPQCTDCLDFQDRYCQHSEQFEDRGYKNLMPVYGITVARKLLYLFSE